MEDSIDTPPDIVWLLTPACTMATPVLACSPARARSISVFSLASHESNSSSSGAPEYGEMKLWRENARSKSTGARSFPLPCVCVCVVYVCACVHVCVCMRVCVLTYADAPTN